MWESIEMFFSGVWQWIIEFSIAAAEAIWYVAWHCFLVYCVYAVKKEEGIGHILGWMGLWCVFYGDELSWSWASMAKLMEVMSWSCLLAALGFGTILWGMFFGWVGYSSTRNGGTLNNLFNK